MNGIELLTASLQSSRKMLEWVLSDLSDSDLLVRPVPGANHFAWQLGHLISSERAMVLEQLPSAQMPELPAGFAEAHGKATSGSDEASNFLSCDAYIALLGSIREATVANVSKLSDADLSRPTVGNMASFCPTLGTLLGLLNDHIMMHLGQATVIRRKLGKPVLF
jgi:hypothetical protein